ncbi:CC_3452 family protein [Stakelama pacifica]|uniref:Uncharacterized protein n=1 Tax=Stakelama pacifica TaxID=517720 RepID=A0A4R6FUP5_9SPHN|nr:hypothetical protein [Stakelama pacifica]TDN85531.1 hypothetical protein EV664_102238 [Stakelama pacifica]GGO92373.1 hypothetical protein GCM10011329_09290 [Stakelama pacifica]
MRLFLSLSAATLFTAATPALAAPGVYLGVPAAASDDATLVTRNTVWHCNKDGCTASHDGQRDMVICQLLARKVGTLTAFIVDGAALDEAALAKCNARAG